MTTPTTVFEETGPYQAVGELLDQGDVVLDVPWGLVQAPPIICRCPQGIGAQSGKGWFAPCHQIADAFARKDPREILHAVARRGPVLVLWHGCQIDKFQALDKANKAFVAVVPILPITQLNEVDRPAVRNGEHMGRFHMPAFSVSEGEIPESYADLRHVWPIWQAALERRVITLTPTARDDLYGHLFTFLTRRRLADTIVCPHCGGPLPTEVLLLPAAE